MSSATAKTKTASAPCQACGIQVSIRAANCPSCGHPIRYVLPRKSRGVFILLGLFFGGVGVHNIYAGHNGKGVMQLLVGLLFVSWVGWLTCGLGFGAWGLYILLDVLLTSHDGQGRRMV